MVNITKLKKEMLNKNVTIPTLAKALDIDVSTVYRKFQHNCEDFSIGEANTIVKFLGLTPQEASDIFFTEIVA